MSDNHNEIIAALVEVSGFAKSADDGVKRINGSIKELTQRVTATEREINRVAIDKNDVIAEMYKFQVALKKEKEYRESFWGNIKLNWVNYIVIGLSTGIAGTFVPLLYMYIKKLAV